MQWVRYTLKSPNDKALARDPGSPPATCRPAKAWIADLEDARASLRVQAGLALAELGPRAREAEAPLTKATKDKDPEVRYAAVFALGASGTEGRFAVLSLAEALRDEASFVRWSAAQALEKLGPKAKVAVPALTQVLMDGFKDFRPLRAAQAAVALVKIEPGAKEIEGSIRLIVEKLLEFEGADSDGSRAVAARMLGECGPAARASVPALVKRLKDLEPPVRVAAAAALMKITPETETELALSTLVAELGNADVFVRLLAADALGELGPRARKARGTLARLLEDPEPEARHAAMDALKRIAPQ
jgi:HEAT repeat protein